MDIQEGQPIEEPVEEGQSYQSDLDRFASYLTESDSLEEETSEPDANSVEDEDSDLLEMEDPQIEAPADTYTVRVQGQDLEVSLDDLKAGYSRTQDYTRKSMALAEQRKAVEAQQAELQQQLQQVQAAMQNLNAPASEEPEPDWDALYQEDPIEWIRQRELWRSKREERAIQQQEQMRLMELAQENQQRQIQQMLQTQTDVLMESIPEWKDPERAKAEKAAIRNWGISQGYLDHELAQVYDARAVTTMRKAMLYDKLMEKRKALKPVQGKTMPAGTGNRGEPSQLRLGKRAAALRQSGSVADAAAYFEEMFRNER
jgi:hypothetical protein